MKISRKRNGDGFGCAGGEANIRSFGSFFKENLLFNLPQFIAFAYFYHHSGPSGFHPPLEQSFQTIFQIISLSLASK